MMPFSFLGPIDRKYGFVLAGSLGFLTLVVLPESMSRFEEAWDRYIELSSERLESVPPGELHSRLDDLTSRERALRLMLVKHARAYEQSRTGVFEFLSEAARSSGLAFESLIPKETEGQASVVEIGFTIGCSADYHRIGKFVSLLERGPFPLQVEHLQLVRGKRRLLEAKIVGRAFVIPGP